MMISSQALRHGIDEVTLALWHSRLRELPEIREDKIRQARTAIGSGQYDCEETLDATLEGLSADLTALRCPNPD